MWIDRENVRCLRSREQNENKFCNVIFTATDTSANKYGVCNFFSIAETIPVGVDIPAMLTDTQEWRSACKSFERIEL
jgi:hypothetical protein